MRGKKNLLMSFAVEMEIWKSVFAGQKIISVSLYRRMS